MPEDSLQHTPSGDGDRGTAGAGGAAGSCGCPGGAGELRPHGRRAGATEAEMGSELGFHYCQSRGVAHLGFQRAGAPTRLSNNPQVVRAQQEKGRGGFEQGRGTGWTAGEGVHGRLRHEPGATLGGAVWTGAGPRRPTCANTSGRRPLLPLRSQTPDGARSTWSRRRTRRAPSPARPALCGTLPH